MFCPKCGDEFREGVSVCPDCHLSLVSQPVEKKEFDDANSVVVYRTGVLLDIDVVADAMTRAGVPYFRRRESIGGLSFAMPVAPSMVPGDLYAIVVPETWADRAKHFIAGLPVPHDAGAGVGAFRSSKELTSQWAWVLVVGLGLLFAWTVFLVFKE